METIRKAPFTLKQILQENWDRYLALYHNEVEWYMALNVWKVINCREPEGLGFATFACPDHPEQICHVPRSCKSRFCSVCAKVQVDRWVAEMNELFPNGSYFHITFTVPSQFRELLFEKRVLQTWRAMANVLTVKETEYPIRPDLLSGVNRVQTANTLSFN